MLVEHTESVSQFISQAMHGVLSADRPLACALADTTGDAGMYRFAPAARQWAAVASIPGVVSSGGLRLFVDTPGVVRGLRV